MDCGEYSSLDTEQSRKWTDNGSESQKQIKSLIIIVILERGPLRQKEVRLPKTTLNGSPDFKSRQSDYSCAHVSVTTAIFFNVF